MIFSNGDTIEDYQNKYPIGYNNPNCVFKMANWGYFTHLGIGDLFSVSDLPDSEIPNPQMDEISPIKHLQYPIGDHILEGYFFC